MATMTKEQKAIDRIRDSAARIKSGKDAKVLPGQPVYLSEAASIGDCIRQGDLYIKVVDKVPDGYKKHTDTVDLDRQLVPGNTEGSRHCLDSLDGVEMYRPKDWGKDDNSLLGPCLKFHKARVILHPTHGHVHIPAGFIVLCRYQRVLDAELKAERRAKD